MVLLSIKTKKKPQQTVQESLPDIKVAENEFSISTSAADHIKKMIAKQNDGKTKVRVVLERGNCMKYSYSIDFVSELAIDDKQFNCHGVDLVISAEHLKLLGGSYLHWEYEGGKGKLNIVNNKIRRRCCCGSAFAF